MLKGTFPVGSILSDTVTPADLNPFIWYSGQDLTSGTITTWEDRAGSNNATQNDASLRPSVSTLNTRNAALFSSGDYLVAPNVFPTSAYTKVALVSVNTITNVLNNIISGTNGHAMRIIDNGDGTGRLRALQGTGGQAINTTAPVININTPYIVHVSWSAADTVVNVYVNGVWVGNLTGAANADNTLHIGGYAGTGNLEGTIAEAIIFDRVLSGDDSYTLYKWLNNYYALNIAETNPILVGIGGSWMQGYGVTGGGTIAGGDGTATGETLLGQLLPNLTKTVTAYNDGVYAQTLTTLLEANTVYTRYRYTSPQRICLFWVTSNDLNQGGDTTTITNNVLLQVRRLRYAGYTVLIMPILPRASPNGSYESGRNTINAALASNAASEGYTYVDIFAGDGSIFNDPAIISNTTYYQGDEIHLTAAAFSVIETLVRPYVNAVLG